MLLCSFNDAAALKRSASSASTSSRIMLEAEETLRAALHEKAVNGGGHKTIAAKFKEQHLTQAAVQKYWPRVRDLKGEAQLAAIAQQQVSQEERAFQQAHPPQGAVQEHEQAHGSPSGVGWGVPGDSDDDL